MYGQYFILVVFHIMSVNAGACYDKVLGFSCASGETLCCDSLPNGGCGLNEHCVTLFRLISFTNFGKFQKHTTRRANSPHQTAAFHGVSLESSFSRFTTV